MSAVIKQIAIKHETLSFTPSTIGTVVKLQVDYE